MKHTKLFLVALLLVFTNAVFATDGLLTLSGGGNGSINSPYKIANLTDLVTFKNAVNAGTDLGAYVELSSNITFSGSAWTAGIGTTTNYFRGSFDGKGYTISGLTLSVTASHGLFTAVGASTGSVCSIRNLNLSNISYTSTSGGYLGGLISTIVTITGTNANGTVTIDNCSVSGTINESNPATGTGSSTIRIGGLVALSASGGTLTITNSSASLTIKASSITANGTAPRDVRCGGIVGDIQSGCALRIVNCFSNGSINAASVGSVYAGGIIANNNNNTSGGVVSGIYNCTSSMSVDALTTNAVTATNIVNVGGISGNASVSTFSEIKNCVALNSHLQAKTGASTLTNVNVARVNSGNPNVGGLASNYSYASMDTKTTVGVTGTTVVSGYITGGSGTDAVVNPTSNVAGKDGQSTTATTVSTAVTEAIGYLNGALTSYAAYAPKTWSVTGVSYPAFAPTISFPNSNAAVIKMSNSAPFVQLATSNSPGAITYSSSNTSLATVNPSTGNVTVTTVPGNAGTAVITATQLANGNLSGATVSYNVQVYAPLTGHPRLFFLTSDEAVLNRNLLANSVFHATHDTILAECDKIINLPVLQRVVVGKRLGVSGEAQRRILFLSYAYRMTGDVRYASRCEAEMLALANFSDWLPSHFLGTAQVTLAMAIGYDWLYNYLGAASRTAIATAIKTKGIDQCTGSNTSAAWWLTSDNNWNQYCNAGISAGVAALYDENPAYYQPLIDRAVESIKLPMTVYQYNGAYPEGYGYWSMGTSFNILFIDLLQRMWGTDSGLKGANGFMSTGNFFINMFGTPVETTSNSYSPPLPFNFSDSSPGGSGVNPEMYWLAVSNNDLNLLYNELKKLSYNLGNKGGVNSNQLLPFLLIWSKNITPANLVGPTEKMYVAQGNSAVAAMRSGWNVNDIYLGLKGGTPSQNHAHMDIGSFVMDANNVRWAADFGISDYNALETNGVNDLFDPSQTSGRWDVFRLNNMAHNTLTINGNKQLSAGYAAIENTINTDTLKSADVNLTSLYSGDVSNCRRTASIEKNRYVAIKDVITSKSAPLTIRWNLLTQATVMRVNNKIIRLSKSSKVLYLVFEGTDSVTAKTWTTTPNTSYEEQNAGYYFTGFEYKLPANTTDTITVRLIPEGDAALSGLNLTPQPGATLNEDFESFTIGKPIERDFLSWKANSTQVELVANPFKLGINTSNNVLKVTRADDTAGITTSNAGSKTYKGVTANGYDLRLTTNSVLEFKYYKDTLGTIGIRFYDGNNTPFLKSYSDPNQNSSSYTNRYTAQWRTAQISPTSVTLSSYNPVGAYLLICLETTGTEGLQEKKLIMYVDDVKLLPLPAPVYYMNKMTVEEKNPCIAYYDSNSDRIYVRNLPDDGSLIKVYNTMGVLLQQLDVYGNVAVLNVNSTKNEHVFILEIRTKSGMSSTLKVIR